jgi:hypothetical protein
MTKTPFEGLKSIGDGLGICFLLTEALQGRKFVPGNTGDNESPMPAGSSGTLEIPGYAPEGRFPMQEPGLKRKENREERIMRQTIVSTH